MNFVLPNTKEEMYSTLQDIFHYYRTRREEWENIDLAPLELDRLDYRTSTTMELATNANKAVVANHLREILKLKTGDKILFVQNENGEIVIHNASTQALLKAQKAFKGEAEKVGIYSDDDVQKLVDEIRKNKNERS